MPAKRRVSWVQVIAFCAATVTYALLVPAAIPSSGAMPSATLQQWQMPAPRWRVGWAFNLEVASSSSYLVGHEATLVHNASSYATRSPIPKLTVLPGRPLAVLEYAGPSPEDAAYLLHLINNPTRLATEVTPLPFTRVDVAPATRSLSGTSSRFPGKILRFSGIGVVEPKIAPHGLGPDRREPALTIGRPRPDVPVSSIANTSTTFVANDGTVWSVKDQSPLGAYAIDVLREKVKNTLSFSPTSDLEIQAAGSYDHSNLGWIAYTLPADVLTVEEVVAQDLRMPPDKIGTHFGAVLSKLFEQVQSNHRRGVVHLQIHPGNWFVRFTDGGPRVVIVDWETASDLSNLPDPSEFNGKEGAERSRMAEEFLEGLTAQQRARALDLVGALGAVTVLNSPQFLSRNDADEFSIPVHSAHMTEESIDHQVGSIVHAFSGYLGWSLSPEQERTLRQNIRSRYEALVVSASDLLGDERVGSYAEVDAGRRGQYVKRHALGEVFWRLARRAVTDSGNSMLSDLLGPAATLRPPIEWYDRQAVADARREIEEYVPRPRTELNEAQTFVLQLFGRQAEWDSVPAQIRSPREHQRMVNFLQMLDEVNQELATTDLSTAAAKRPAGNLSWLEYLRFEVGITRAMENLGLLEPFLKQYPRPERVWRSRKTLLQIIDELRNPPTPWWRRLSP